MSEYTPKVDAIMAHAVILGFTERDFVDLAMASADQAGADARDQKTIRLILEEIFAPRCANCGAVIDASPGGMCDACQDIDARLAAYQRAEAIREGRGDYMRDQSKDRDHPDYDTREEKDMDHE